MLQTADFPFRIAIPEGLPPTCKLDKQSGISYEIVSSLCVKMPKGLFRKDTTTSVIQSVHPILIEKHEMHSTWPIYNQPDLHSGEKGLLRAKLRRDRSCYAPGDKVNVKIIVYSNRVEPAKLKSVAFSIKETVTFHGVKSSRMSLTSSGANAQKPASQHVETIAQRAKQVGKKMYKGDSLNFDLECTIPKSHGLMTISTAKHIEVSYTMRVYVDISKAPIVIDHIPMIMTTFPRSQSAESSRKIGFVEGLSERELVIEDDDDGVSPQVVSRSGSSRPSPSRSASFGGSSASGGGGGYGANNGLRRRDTVMTNFSGPGMAGFGVPGQIFHYGSYGAVQSYNPNDMVQPPRSAFAGPSSVFESEGALSATERTALSHYQTATPHSALALGVDYNTIATASGLGTPPAVPRSHFDAIPEEARPDVERHLQHHNLHSLSPRTEQQQQQQQREAEEEKERLYQRARQQAERNQRKADERRAQAIAQARMSGTGSLPPSASNSRTGTPVLGSTRNGTPIRPSSAAALSSMEEEKKRLYERARREAETYQRGYAQGATFPEEQDERSATPQQKRASAPASDMRNRLSVQPESQYDARRRSSGMYWLDSPSVDPNEARGNHAPASQPSTSSTALAPVVTPSTTILPAIAPPTASALSMPKPPGAFPSAEEEKKRLYDEAKAQTENHLQQQEQGSSSSALTPTAGPNKQVGDTAVPPLSEKAQLGRFQAAQDAVQRFQTQGSTVTNVQQRPQSSSALAAAPPPPMTTPASPPPVLSEKEQMRLYYQAKDRQAGAEEPGASMSTSQRHSMGPTPTMANPRPTYAPNYQNGAVGWQQNNSSPLPQGPFASQAATGASSSARSVSHTLPPPAATNGTTGSPSLPALGSLLLGNDNSAWRGGTPIPTEGPWAPKVASSLWDSSTDDAPSAPPPLPPKTPLVITPRH